MSRRRLKCRVINTEFFRCGTCGRLHAASILPSAGESHGQRCPCGVKLPHVAVAGGCNCLRCRVVVA